MNTQIQFPATEPEFIATRLPQATCCAHLEDLIEAMPMPACGRIAQWSGSEHDAIEIIGRIRLRGYFETDGVRWICRNRGAKGLFGKGYVAMKPERLALLPFVK